MLARRREGCISQGRSVHLESRSWLRGLPSRSRNCSLNWRNFPKRDGPPTKFSTSSRATGFAVESLLGSRRRLLTFR